MKKEIKTCCAAVLYGVLLATGAAGAGPVGLPTTTSPLGESGPNILYQLTITGGSLNLKQNTLSYFVDTASNSCLNAMVSQTATCMDPLGCATLLSAGTHLRYLSTKNSGNGSLASLLCPNADPSVASMGFTAFTTEDSKSCTATGCAAVSCSGQGVVSALGSSSLSVTCAA
jgi:hypothetical protein